MKVRWHHWKLQVVFAAGCLIFLSTNSFAELSPAPLPCGAETPCDAGALNEQEAGVLISEFSYEDLKQLMASGEPYVLLDTRAEAMFLEGRIPSAVSLPLETISLQKAQELIKPVEHIIVYCQSRSCKVSHNAAAKLIGYGFNVKDYKGGIAEWVEKGNTLEGQAPNKP